MSPQRSKTSQRARLAVLLLGILLLGLAGQTWLINTYLLSNFQRLEENQLRASTNVIRLWLDSNYQQPLRELAVQLAESEESSKALVAGPAEDWQRFLAETHARSPKFDLAATSDADGRLTSAVEFDRNHAVTEATGTAVEVLTAAAGQPDNWVIDGGVLLVSTSQPIGTTGDHLVLARRFPQGEQDFLQQLSGARIQPVLTESRPNLVPGMGPGEFRRGGTGNQALEICQLLGAGTAPRRFMLCAQLEDSIYLSGKAGVDDLRLATLLGFVLLIFVAWMFMDRVLLQRLQSLVGALRATKDIGTEALEQALLADSKRDDELGQLSGGMGHLLSQVREGESELRQQQENFRSLTESAGVGIFVIRDTIIYANPFAEKITGYTFLELLDRRLPDLMHPNDKDRIEARVGDSANGQGRSTTEDEVQGQTKDGGNYWARLHTVSLYYQGEPAVLVTLYDTSEQRHLQAAVAREKERLQVILSSIQDGIVSLDASGRVNYLNTAAERLIGHTVDSALGKHLRDVAMFADPRTEVALPPSSIENLSMGGAPMQAMITTPTGDRRDAELKRSPLLSTEGSDRPGSVVVLRDVSELRRMTRHLEHQATHDELTGLFNRREFNNRLSEALSKGRAANVEYALCYMDLDQFKTVNDICGHQAGDQMLKQITAAVQPHLREEDTIARLGGDEFGLLLRCPSEKAVAIANQVRTAISDVRFAWGGRTFGVDASIGIAMLDQIEGEIDEALSIVDATCYMAKEEGRNRVRVYQPGDVDLQRQFGQMRWAQRLKDALEQEQFLLFQQGIHPLTTEVPPACEVLVRLTDNKGKIIGAGDFIEAAERYQMMPALDRFIVQSALTHMINEKKATGKIGRTYFVNLSGHSLGDEAFHTFLLDCFKPEASEITPHLVFEVTESAVISNLGRARKLIQELRKRGIRFALDDFGTGMSSFAYLKELDVQFLKIAGPFVRNLPRNSLDQTIVRNFTTFGKQMGLTVIAEWIEDRETLDMLKTIGVDYAQGYALDKPEPLALKAPMSALHLG